MTGITVLLVVLALAIVVGLLLRRRSGAVRTVTPTDGDDAGGSRVFDTLVDAGARAGTPTVLHFSADWCGPCAAVRRVVQQVLSDRPGIDELELDIDAHPALAREFGVLSLPTTFVLDAELRQRSRIAGVPSAAALRSALDAL